MRMLIVLLVLTLAGCLNPTRPAPVVVTKTVEVPVTVKCVISYPQEPSAKATDPAQTDSPVVKAKAALAELEGTRQYAKELRAVLQKCASDSNSVDVRSGPQ